MDIERMKAELKAEHGHLDWYLTNRQVRRMYAELMERRQGR